MRPARLATEGTFVLHQTLTMILGLAAGLCLSLASCGGDGDANDGGFGMGCVPNASTACACVDGGMGAQICLPDGSGFEPCMCDGGDGTGGEETGSMTDGTAGMDMGADSTGGAACGNGIEDPNECDATHPSFCAEDCMSSAEDTAGSSDGVASCDDEPIFALMIPNIPSIWEDAGVVGFQAGTNMCAAMGADHVCDYEELVAAAAKNEFAAVPAGTTAWLHRTVSVMNGGVMVPPGVGGRCVDWTYGTNHISDGEYATFDAGVPTFTFDNDTNYNAAAPAPNPHVQMGLLECGGTMRAIPCCYPECIPEG